MVYGGACSYKMQGRIHYGMCHAKHCTQHTVLHFALQCSKKAGRAGRCRTPFIGLTARGACLACEAGVSKLRIGQTPPLCRALEREEAQVLT